MLILSSFLLLLAGVAFVPVAAGILSVAGIPAVVGLELG